MWPVILTSLIRSGLRRSAHFFIFDLRQIEYARPGNNPAPEVGFRRGLWAD
jgi:hypothetical protein